MLGWVALIPSSPSNQFAVADENAGTAVWVVPQTLRKATAWRFYLPELDILRFLAFAWMFQIHASISFPALNAAAKPRILWTGFYTIDLFFAMSAYLLTQLLMREWEQRGSIDVKAFYIRRGLRVWPLYFLLVAVGFILSSVMDHTKYAVAFHVPSGYTKAFLVFLGNFAFCRWSSPVLVVTMLWTLSIEEQVYIVLPWLVYRASRRAVRIAGTALVVVANVSRVEFAVHWSSGVPVWFHTLTHLDAVGIGMLLATVPYTWFAALKPLQRITLGAIGIACWAFANNYYLPLVAADTADQVIWSYPVAIAGAGAILAATIGVSGGEIKSLFGRALAYLGKISYGLYIYHGLGILLTLLFFSPFPRHDTDPIGIQILKQAGNSAISFGFTLCVGVCSYRWFETPFLKLKKRFTAVPSRPI